MQYIYKNGLSYIYKRRIPSTNQFYIFNLQTKNYKKASKIVIVFNKLTFDIFNFIKKQGGQMALNFEEAIPILDDYKTKALKEYQEFERTRHLHLEKLFKIEEEDPLLGTRILSGGDSKVIEQALQSFKNLSLSDTLKSQNKKVVLKIGKELVSRSTPQIKDLFTKLRANEDDLFTFLSLLLKWESSILQVDYKRVNERFNPNYHPNIPTNQSNSLMEKEEQKHTPLTDIIDNFLYIKCGYSKADLVISQSQCAKVNKMTELFLEFMRDNVHELTSKNITVKLLRECISIIIDIPKKSGNITSGYNYYTEYKKLEKNIEYEKRSISSIEQDQQNFRKFVKYLKEKKFISLEDFEDLETYFTNQKTLLKSLMVNGKISSGKERVAFKLTMLESLFSIKNPFYKTIFDIFQGKKKLRVNTTREYYEGRFYIPLLLLFTGARIEEMASLKVDDFEIREYSDGTKRILVYLEANEKRGLKNFTSRRVILVHDYLTNDLDFIGYLQKCRKEEREYLFNLETDIGAKVGKEFNRENVKDICITPYLTREDTFNLNHYSTHSLRHNYKTHMLLNRYSDSIIAKIQGHKIEKKSSDGYITYDSAEYVELINSFSLHQTLEMEIFKEVARIINYD